MSRRAVILMLVTFAILATGGFYLRVLVRRIFESPPHEEAARAQLSQAALQPATKPGEEATLYFPSYTEGKLVAQTCSIAWAASDTDRIRQVLLALMEGSRSGPNQGLPPSTTIRGIFLTSDGTAYLDFSSEGWSDSSPGIDSETLVVYSVVASIARNIPSVKSVKFLIQGQEAETLNGHVDLGDAFVPDLSRMTLSPL